MDSLDRAFLWPQTRCYVRDHVEDLWSIGRIGQYDKSSGDYEVHFPNLRSLYLPEELIRVRCSVPVLDPMETLVHRGHETPFFHDRRFSFVRMLVRQRATSRGLTGLTSACVELYPHQLEVIRRVLEDPVQRYLLADEVGLGKTIEAGVILRQFLLDTDDERALVIVPTHLVMQWTEELREKIRFADFQDRVKVIDPDGLRGPRSNDEKHEYSMLIVDEAHHVCSMSVSDDPQEAELFELHKQLAHKAERLLLLSATPALDNEASFLAMLHLLDPTVYHLGDIGAFRERVEKRRDLGRILLLLREGGSDFVITRTVNRLKSLLGDDPIVAEKCDAILAAKSKDQRAGLVRALHTHVSEAYRLHRRMLRNRRLDVAAQLSAGRYDEKKAKVSVGLEPDLADAYCDRVDELLESWRVAANIAVERSDDSEIQQDLVRRYSLLFMMLFEASQSSPDLLRRVIGCRLGKKIVEPSPRDFSDAQLALLKSTELYDGERELLAEVLIVLESVPWKDSKHHLIVELLGGLHGKIAILSSFSTTARNLAEELEEALGPEAVAVHLFDATGAESAQAIKRFRDSTECNVLIADGSGEEGLNLQHIDWCIHYDLPFAPNRLEQRIGRFDRIGRARPLKSKILCGSSSDVTLMSAWIDVLRDGFGLFRESIASLQFFVEREMSELVAVLFFDGASGLRGRIPKLREDIEQELLKIREESAIDAIDARSQTATEFFQTLRRFDDDADSLRRSSDEWIVDALRFRVASHEIVPDVFRYDATRDTLVPRNLILLEIARTLPQQATFCRRTATEIPDVSLVRRGAPFVDEMERYIRWDDRGRAFAVWRWQPDLGSRDVWIGFRFNYLVEGDDEPSREALVDFSDSSNATPTALQRALDALFPPVLQPLLVDADLKEVSDESMIARLTVPYESADKGGRDYNLSKDRLQVLDELFQPEAWVRLCHEARQTSEAILSTHPALQSAISTYSQRGKRVLQQRLDQIGTRARLQDLPERELEFAGRLHEALLDGVTRPRITLDSVGLIVLSGRKPLPDATKPNG